MKKTREKLVEDLAAILDLAGEVFLQFRMDACKKMKGDGSAAAVLAYIMNELKMAKRNVRELEKLYENELWFECPAKHIQEDLGMHGSKQYRIVERLKKWGFVRTKTQGWPRRLWIRIRTKRFSKKEHSPPVLGGLTEPTVPLKRGDYNPPKIGGIYNRGKKKNKNNCSPSGNGDISLLKSSTDKSSSPVRELVGWFYQQLKIRGLVLRHPAFKQWHREMKELIQEIANRDRVGFTTALEKVRRDVGFYFVSNLWKDKYAPQIRSVGSLRSKYQSLEEAIKRHGKETGERPERKVKEEVLANGDTRVRIPHRDDD